MTSNSMDSIGDNMNLLSNCCNAHEWLGQPEFDVYTGKWSGVCGKCQEHAQFYDDNDDSDAQFEARDER